MAATLIKNGRIVTAVDDYTADIVIVDGRIQTIGRNIAVGADVKVHDANGLLVLPAALTYTPTWTGSSVRHTQWTLLKPERKPRLLAERRLSSTFCNQTAGKSPLVGLEDWHKRRASACVDVGAHMIMLDVNEQSLADMKTLVRREGVTSFKLFMAYPGVPDGGRWRAVQGHARGGCQRCHDLYSRRERPGHSGSGPGSSGAGTARSQVPRHHPPVDTRREATHRAICLAELAGTPLYIVHLSAGEALSAVTEARDRGIPVHAETCPHYLFLTAQDYDRPGFEGAKYRHDTAITRSQPPAAPLARSEDRRPAGGIDRPLPVLLRRKALWDEVLQAARRGQFQQNPQRCARSRDPIALIFDGAVKKQGHVDQSFRRNHLDGTGQAVRSVPAQGRDRGGIGRGHRAVRFLTSSGLSARRNSTAGSNYTLFEGRPVTGRVKKVFLRGQCIVDGTGWLGRAGMGEYLTRGESGKI